MTSKDASRAPPPPEGLEATFIDDGDETFVVLSFPVATPSLPGDLTPSERAIVELVLAGRRTSEIAEVRGVSVRTVSNQLQSAYRKLGVSSRAELAARLRSRTR
jgi:DNA-binding CsgD family transcriptional regulator